jgi:hypothetical protein
MSLQEEIMKRAEIADHILSRLEHEKSGLSMKNYLSGKATWILKILLLIFM